MPINVFGNSSSSINDNKIDTSKFVNKNYLKLNYIEEDISHDIDCKNQYKIINLSNPINNKDSVNKIYIDNKIADIIKRNIQTDDYISFLDNDNNEYKLEKYRPRIQLTDITLFNMDMSGSDCSSKWHLFCSTKPITTIFTTRSQITPSGWGTGPGAIYENLNFFVINTFYMLANTQCEISRNDIHNVSKIEIVISRYSNNNTMGEFSVLYKNDSDNWIEILKLSENSELTDREEWGTFTIDINENNYGIKFIFDKKNSHNQITAISKITLTYKI